MGKRTNKTATKVDLPGFLDVPARGQARQIGNTAEWLRANPYEGDWAPGLNKDMLSGNRMTSQVATDLQTGGGGRALYDLGTATARGDYLNLDSNPVFLEYLQSGILDPINKVYEEQLFPGLEGQNVGMNTFDNLRYGIERAKLGTDQADLTRQATGDATMGLYNAERERQMLASNLINAGTAQMLLPGTIKSQAGADQRALEQLKIDTALANRYGQLTEQDRLIMSLLPLMQTYAGQQTTTPGVNKTASTAQGVIGGASAGSSMGALGAVLGGLLGGAGGYYG
jgi:hypothetical protein